MDFIDSSYNQNALGGGLKKGSQPLLHEWFASKDSTNSNPASGWLANFYLKTIGLDRIQSLQPINNIDLPDV